MIKKLKKLTKKHITVLFFILILVFTFGCSGTSISNNTRPPGSGLTLKIDSITSTIYDSDAVDMEVLLQNLGDYSIPPGDAWLKLSGYDPTLFSFSGNGISSTGLLGLGEIEGNENGSSGFSDYVSLGSGSLKQGFLGENIPQISPTFVVNACYLYKTTATAQICMNPDIYGTNPQVGACKVGFATIYNSNGPLKVTSVRENYLSYDKGSGILRVKLDITVSNIGRGQIWSPLQDYYEYNCGVYNSQTNIRQIQNKIEVKDPTLSGQPLDCSTPSGSTLINMVGNSASFSCIGEMDKVYSAFTTQMQIVLWYGNSISISKQVTIKSSQYTS